MWKQINEDAIESLSLKSIEMLEKVLDQEIETSDPGRLAPNAAKAILKSQGLLGDRPKAEPRRGVGFSRRVPIREIVINVPPDMDEPIVAVEPPD